MSEEKRLVPRRRFKEFENAPAWEQRNLGEIGEIITGSTPSTIKESYYSKEGIPWITPTDITKRITYDSNKKLSDEGVKVARIVPRNTLLITCIASIGKNTMLGTKGSFNQQINAIVPNLREFESYFLLTQSELWSNIMKVMADQGTMQIINKTEFSKISTKIPNLEEQKKIGLFFQSFDNLITLHQQQLEKLKELKKSYLKEMFI